MSFQNGASYVQGIFLICRSPISLMKIVLIVAIDKHYLLQRSPISFFMCFEHLKSLSEHEYI